MSSEEFTGHVRAMRADAEYFGAEDLQGLGDVPFQIVKCERHVNHKACGKTVAEMYTLTLADRTGRAASKRFWIKPTNRKAIVSLYGANVAEWKGKWLWLYVTEVKSPAGGETLGIRIRQRKDAPPQVSQQQEGAK
jgi:hypothetical protein